MYNEFYGLKENPFDLTPDPQFLYLSDKHRDALKYLMYGIRKRKGFILITGEVGTGKTTLCRFLLEELPDDIITALILNPSLSAKDLLLSITSELGIDNHDAKDKNKLILLLNDFLIQKLKKGNNVVVIIDEAQNLSPQLLEQLRIISNLETNKEKLIQIVLVGQPELDAMLKQPELRQLDQRISLRFHLDNLNPDETKKYIQHRLSIAGSKGDISFTPAAQRKIFNTTKGYPRLINIICDQVLLSGSYAMTRQINPRIIQVALKNTLRHSGFSLNKSFFSTGHIFAASAVVIILLSVLLAAYFRNDGIPFSAKTVKADSAQKTPADRVEPTSSAQTVKKASAMQKVIEEKVSSHTENSKSASVLNDDNPDTNIMPEIIEYDDNTSLYDDAKKLFNEIGSYDLVCLAVIFESWGVNAGSVEEIKTWAGSSPGMFSYMSTATRYGFSIARIRTETALLDHFRTPCILLSYQTNDFGSPPHAVVLTGSIPSAISILDPKEGKLVYSADDFYRRWSGTALIIWKKPMSMPRYLKKGMNGAHIATLDRQLKRLGYLNSEEQHLLYNNVIEDAVKQFQKAHKLKTDGIAGPITQFFMQYNLYTSQFPKLHELNG